MSPLRTGTALAITVAVFYALCTAVWVAAPAAFLEFMNGLFHGLDFSPMLATPGFEPVGSFRALLVLSLWAFLAGALYGVLARRLARGEP